MEQEMMLRRDPLTVAIAEGKVLPRPIPPLGTSLILPINIDNLARRMKNVLGPIVALHPSVRLSYVGATPTIVDAEIRRDVDHMVDTMMSILYNRLRTVLELNNPHARPVRMNPRAPTNNKLEFPAYLSSLLSSIGPLRITDAARDTLILYATAAEQMQTYGRANIPPFEIGRYVRLNQAFRASNVRMAPIDIYQQDTPSFFSTMTPTLHLGSWTFYGEAHPSHYENEDIPRAYLTLDPDVNNRPFDFCGTPIDFCTTPNVVAAVAAARPPGVAAAVDGPTAPTDPVSFIFPTNIFGIRPATQRADGAEASPAGVYILGRGNEIYYRTMMAHHLTTGDLDGMIIYRMFHSG